MAYAIQQRYSRLIIPGKLYIKPYAHYSRWGDLMPFVIDDGDFPASSTERTEVERGIAMWNSQTNVSLRPATDEDDSWLQFRASDTGCGTFVGWQGYGAHRISCDVVGGFRRGNIAHEIGHAYGLWHEHQRPDRGKYVKLAESAKKNYQFLKSPEVVVSGPYGVGYAKPIKIGSYDCGSIMHYPYRKGGLKKRKNGCAKSASVGQRSKLSSLDVAAINRMARNLSYRDMPEIAEPFSLRTQSSKNTDSRGESECCDLVLDQPGTISLEIALRLSR